MRAAAPSTRAQHRALQEASRLPFDIPGSSEREVTGQVLEDIGLGLMLEGAGKLAVPVAKAALRKATPYINDMRLSRAARRGWDAQADLARETNRLDDLAAQRGINPMVDFSDKELKKLHRLSAREREVRAQFDDLYRRTGGVTFTPDPTAEGWGAMVDVFGTPTHSGTRQAGSEGIEFLDLAFTTKGKKLTKKGAAHNVLFSPDVRAQVTGGERLGGILDLLDNVQLPTEKGADELTNTLARLLSKGRNR